MTTTEFVYRYTVRTVEYHTEEITISAEEAADTFVDPTCPTVEEVTALREAQTKEIPEKWHDIDGSSVTANPGPELLQPAD